MSEKECTKCGGVKAFSEYGKHKLGKHGLNGDCKVCRKEYAKQRYQATKEAVAEYRKQYYQTNKEAINERMKQHKQANREAYNEYQKKYYQANKDATAERMKQYRQANKEVIAEKNKQYRQANKKAIAEINKQYRQANKEKLNKKARRRKAKNPTLRMIGNLRNGLVKAMNGTSKPKKTMELLGCSRKQFKKHLSAQFTEGMTLENYGSDGWVIDHIMPVSRFDHSDPEQVAICWHHTNMQPMWGIDNIIKSDMLPHEWEEFKITSKALNLWKNLWTRHQKNTHSRHHQTTAGGQPATAHSI